METTELAIIGGGPGGLSAAVEAAGSGVNVTILDENAQVGGQIFRQLEKGFTLTNPEAMGRDYQKSVDLFRQFKQLAPRITCLNHATVWGIFDDHRIAYGRHGKSKTIEYKNLVIASGAYDRPVPFPGWTLPGVLTAGGAQNLVKNQRILPGKKILLAGTGPLQLVVAHQLIQAGADIAAILEAGDVNGMWLKLMKGMWGNWGYAGDGLRYVRTIRKAGVPIMQNHIITRVNGNQHAEEAVIARVDKDWRVIHGTQTSLKVDTVCLGYGLVTSSELTRLAQCDHTYDSGLGGYVPVRSQTMETSRKGIFAVGDGAGVAGSQVALAEGRIAGIAVTQALGRESGAGQQKILAGLQKKLARHHRLRAVLDEISRPRPGLYELAEDETIICRCEDITFKQIQTLIQKGGTTAKDIKRKTRAGMGSCNGRICGPILIELLNNPDMALSPQPGGLNVRPPVKPVSLGVLAGVGDNQYHMKGNAHVSTRG